MSAAVFGTLVLVTILVVVAIANWKDGKDLDYYEQVRHKLFEEHTARHERLKSLRYKQDLRVSSGFYEGRWGEVVHIDLSKQEVTLRLDDDREVSVHIDNIEKGD